MKNDYKRDTHFRNVRIQSNHLEYVNSSLQLWTKYSDEQMIRSFRQRQERLYRELKYCIRKFNEYFVVRMILGVYKNKWTLKDNRKKYFYYVEFYKFYHFLFFHLCHRVLFIHWII